MNLRFLLLLVGLAHSYALLSKDLQSLVNKKLMPSSFLKMKATDPNWKGDVSDLVFEQITKAGLFRHRETNEIFLETEEKLWMEYQIVEQLANIAHRCGWTTYLRNLIQNREWNELFLLDLHGFGQFRRAWRESMSELINVNDRHGNETILMKSLIMKDETKVLKNLLERGADVNATEIDMVYDGHEFFLTEGRTALDWAAAKSEGEVIALLLQFKANINAVRIQNGETPLITAVWNHNADAVEVLLKNGANFEWKSKEKQTALDIARDIQSGAVRDYNQTELKYYQKENDKIIVMLEKFQKQKDESLNYFDKEAGCLIV